jgi:hypothetical protein
MQRGLVFAALAGCHVVQTSELARPNVTARVAHTERAIAQQPQLVVTDAGTFRFIEPLSCPTTETVEIDRAREVAVRPNLATFVVGVIATGVGGVLAITGASGDEPASDPLTYAGVGQLVIGLPLAIGPWIGNHAFEVAGTPATETRPGGMVPCGDRPLVAHAARLSVHGTEVYGAIAADGTFEVSPFTLVDAFAIGAEASLGIDASVDGNGAHTISASIDSATLASRAPAFLAHADFDATIEPMRLVPGVVAGPLRASLTSTSTGAALRVVLDVKNDGPGDAYALRGYLVSETRAIDGRVLYVGRVAKGASATRELLIPLAADDAARLRGSTVRLFVELHDAHGTAPGPIKFEGAVLGDAPR